MGIVNCTAQSLYGTYTDLSAVLVAVEKMVVEGATIIDIGAEATNPDVGFQFSPKFNQQEMDLLALAVEAVAKRFDVLISVDTSQPIIMSEMVALGAGMINDQRALRLGDAKEVVARLEVPVCLMHLFNPAREPGGSPEEMLAQISQDLRQWVDACVELGIARDRIIIDPGFGQGHYGKNAQENFYLLAHLNSLQALGVPILAGLSRKSMIAEVIANAPVSERLFGSIAAALLAVQQGANIIRVHDIKATVDALAVLKAYQKES